MKIRTDPRVAKTIRSLPEKDNSEIVQVVELFRDYGFQLTIHDLKKLTRNLWELRVNRYRLLFGMVNNEVIIVHIFLKKTQKTPKKEIELAKRRLTQTIYE